LQDSDDDVFIVNTPTSTVAGSDVALRQRLHKQLVSEVAGQVLQRLQAR
jgi:hypothetical protein